MIANENFVVLDVNGDGHINDIDRNVMRILLNNESDKYVATMINDEGDTGYDINGDGKANKDDIPDYKKLFDSKDEIADLNKDGVVNEKDSEILNSYTTGLRDYYDRIGETSKKIEEAVGEGKKLMDKELTN